MSKRLWIYHQHRCCNHVFLLKMQLKTRWSTGYFVDAWKWHLRFRAFVPFLEYLDSFFSISKQSPSLAIDEGLLTCICNKRDGAFSPNPLSLAIAAAVQSPLQLPSLGR